MRTWNDTEQQVIRAVVALCAVAAQSDIATVRDDMRDEAMAGVGLWMADTDAHPHMVRWCNRLAAQLESLSSQDSVSLKAVLTAHAAILRLRSSLGGSTPAPKKESSPPAIPLQALPLKPLPLLSDIGRNHKKVLDFVRANPDVRTREVVDRFAGSLSDRTVKRCLKDLAASGHLSRVQIDGAVQYRLAQQ